MGPEVRTLESFEACLEEGQQEGARVGADKISKRVQLFNARFLSMASKASGAAALDQKVQCLDPLQDSVAHQVLQLLEEQNQNSTGPGPTLVLSLGTFLCSCLRPDENLRNQDRDNAS